ncbi:MAG: InlB B-repeat-containing protein [Clostridia bacterium]
MKIKKLLLLFILCIASICLFSLSTTVNAATISDDGKYSLVLNVMDGEIDGDYAKIVRFNIAEGETTVSLSELTSGIVPFNGKNEFSHWGKNMSDDEKADEELAIADFTNTGSIGYTSGDVNYTNGLLLWAKFSDKELKGTGTYYLTLDPFAGTINGKANIRLTSKSTEFKTVDLTKYTPIREGYTFVGWDLNGKFVTSIDSSAFANGDAVNVTATYTKNSFDGDDIILVLDANGGTIDGKSSNKYDYVGGANSGTSMSLLPYIPTKSGYTFAGWNTKADGTGNNKKYIYWREWWDDEKNEYISEPITLYAKWTKNSEKPQEPTKDTVKVVESSSTTKGNIEFETEVSKEYVLDIKLTEVKKELADKNVKFIADINVLEDGQVVKISDTKMKISIALPDDLKGYNKYEVVYILNGEIKETIPATVEDGYIVFETTHLSEYGIVATNVEENNKTENTVINNPKTGDNIIIFSIIFVLALTGILVTCIISRKRVKNNK